MNKFIIFITAMCLTTFSYAVPITKEFKKGEFYSNNWFVTWGDTAGGVSFNTTTALDDTLELLSFDYDNNILGEVIIEGTKTKNLTGSFSHKIEGYLNNTPSIGKGYAVKLKSGSSFTLVGYEPGLALMYSPERPSGAIPLNQEYDIPEHDVPEPMSGALMLLGLSGLLYRKLL